MLHLPLLSHTIRIRILGEKKEVYDPIRKRWLILTPEEHVRQLLLQQLLTVEQYPQALISVEKRVLVNGKPRRFDIVVYSRDAHRPWMLIECKAPDVPVTEAALYQLLDYHSELNGQYWMITNGHQHYCADATDTSNINWLKALPPYQF